MLHAMNSKLQGKNNLLTFNSVVEPKYLEDVNSELQDMKTVIFVTFYSVVFHCGSKTKNIYLWYVMSELYNISSKL